VFKIDVDERRPSCYYAVLRTCKSDVSSVQCLLKIDTIYPGFKPESLPKSTVATKRRY
jgi:hypothetical protein